MKSLKDSLSPAGDARDSRMGHVIRHKLSKLSSEALKMGGEWKRFVDVLIATLEKSKPRRGVL